MSISWLHWNNYYNWVYFNSWRTTLNPSDDLSSIKSTSLPLHNVRANKWDHVVVSRPRMQMSSYFFSFIILNQCLFLCFVPTAALAAGGSAAGDRGAVEQTITAPSSRRSREAGGNRQVDCNLFVVLFILFYSEEGASRFDCHIMYYYNLLISCIIFYFSIYTYIMNF